MLQEVITAYLAAQVAGSPSLIPRADNTTYTENDVVINIAEGILGLAIMIDLSRSLLDTAECATFIEISAATNKHPYVIDTRMLVSGDTVTSIESVIADAGDWFFNTTS